MSAKDYYKTLGVEKEASQEEIKKAFRKLAHQHHPDKPGGDEAKFKEANEAYQVLGDEKKRAQYDQFGSSAFDGNGGGGGGFGGFHAQGFEGVDFGDIFGDMFGFGGGRGGRGRTRQGSDIQVDLELSFHDAIFGVQREITLTKMQSCAHCDGIGAEPGTKTHECETCHGSGTIVQEQRTMLGPIRTQRVCSECEGEGKVPETVCTTCHGSGLTKQKKTITIRIPSAVNHGDMIRVTGEGEAIKSGRAGDLFLRVFVKSDRRFVRDGYTIRSEVRVGFTQAGLGAELDVPTVDGGDVTIKVPAGTQSGTELRLRGKGVPHGSGRGDQLVTVQVVTPGKLSREQKKLLEELDLKASS